MRRLRRDATKVWHNPEIQTFPRRSEQGGAAARSSGSRQDAQETKKHRAALEALFAPRQEPEPDSGKGGARKIARDGAGVKAVSRIVLAPPPQSDPQATERQRLLGKLLGAEGRPKIAKAATEFLRAGFTFPEEQDVYLQLLEHTDETHVRSAIDMLATLLVGELPKRRAVLESRLRRIEQFAEDADTRRAAERLRRRVTGRPEDQGPPSTEAQ
jgi:uncharacterized small protein (DUF1192 family)